MGGDDAVYRLQHLPERVHPLHHHLMIIGDLVVAVVLHAVYTEVVTQLVALSLQAAHLRIHPDKRAEEQPPHGIVPEVDDRRRPVAPSRDDPSEAGGDDRQAVHPVAALHHAACMDGIPADRSAREDRVGIVGEVGRCLSVGLQHVAGCLSDGHGTLLHLLP